MAGAVAAAAAVTAAAAAATAEEGAAAKDSASFGRCLVEGRCSPRDQPDSARPASDTEPHKPHEGVCAALCHRQPYR